MGGRVKETVMKRYVVAALLLLSVLSLTPSCSSNQPSGVPATTTPTPVPTQVSVPQSQNLVNATITVSPGSYYEVPFSVNVSKMLGARVTGSFTASGGLPGNGIIALVMDDMAFINWKSQGEVSFLYTSGQMTEGIIYAPIGASGLYHLVFDNTFCTKFSKKVPTSVDLTWSELIHQ